MSLFKGTKLYSIIKGTCPVCQEESMYTHTNPYRLGSLLQMQKRCSHCATKYDREPSFFYGAMYVSYPVGICFAGIAHLFSSFVLGLGLLASFFVVAFVLLLCMPIITRLARNIWINIFLSYDPKWKERVTRKY